MMSFENKTVLYIGNSEASHAFAATVEPQGWAVFHATTLQEALGMYVTYIPGAVVFDAAASCDLVQAAFFHIESTGDNKPTVILEDNLAVWGERRARHLCVLSPDVPHGDLLKTITDMQQVCTVEWS